jgi:hypothetical protein
MGGGRWSGRGEEERIEKETEEKEKGGSVCSGENMRE